MSSCSNYSSWRKSTPKFVWYLSQKICSMALTKFNQIRYKCLHSILTVLQFSWRLWVVLWFWLRQKLKERELNIHCTGTSTWCQTSMSSSVRAKEIHNYCRFYRCSTTKGGRSLWVKWILCQLTYLSKEYPIKGKTAGVLLCQRLINLLHLTQTTDSILLKQL